MSNVIPTVSEYARMSWQARMRTTQRLNELARPAESLTIAEAEAILATIPPDPPWLTAWRREALAQAVRPRKGRT